MGSKRGIVGLAAAALMAVGVVSAGSPSQAAAAPSSTAASRTNAGNYHPLTPDRVVDSRSGLGTAKGAVTPGSDRLIDPTPAGVPTSGVSAVVVTVTVVSAVGDGWLTAYPDGASLPNTSTINYRAGWTGAATATVPVGASGKFRVSAGKGATDFLVDVIGYYSTATAAGTGALLTDEDPLRVFDSRTNGGAVVSGTTRTQRFRYADKSGSALSAVAVTLTATSPSARGWLTAWSGAGSRPLASTVNYGPGETSANTTIVPVRNEGNGIYSYAVTVGGSGSTQMLIDEVGLYTTALDGVGLAFEPLPPTRIVDSRSGLGTAQAALGAGVSRPITVPASVMTNRTGALAANITGTGATQPSWLTAWSGGSSTSASTVNFSAGQDRANSAPLALRLRTTTGRPSFSLLNGKGTADVVVDVTGRFVAVADAGRAPQPVMTAATDGARAAAAATPAVVKNITTWVGYDKAHVVSAPSGVQQVRAIVPTGTSFTGDLSGGWLLIRSGPFAGSYIDGGSLSTYDPANPAHGTSGAATVAPVGQTVTRYVLATNYRVNVRSGPSYAASLVGSAGNGASFTGRYVNADWFQITAGGYAGQYVSGAVLNRTAAMADWNGKIPSADLCLVPSGLNSTWEAFTGRYLNCTALRGLLAMDAAFTARFGRHLIIDEGYRDVAKQIFFFDMWGYPATAYPGTSTHGIGRAIDLWADVTSPYRWGQPEDLWLTANSGAYGWDRPSYYDSIGSSSEYWHYNFVG